MNVRQRDREPWVDARHAARAARTLRPAAAPHVAALGRLSPTLGELNDATITTERLGAAIAFDFDALAAYGTGLVVGVTGNEWLRLAPHRLDSGSAHGGKR